MAEKEELTILNISANLNAMTVLPDWKAYGVWVLHAKALNCLWLNENIYLLHELSLIFVWKSLI